MTGRRIQLLWWFAGICLTMTAGCDMAKSRKEVAAMKEEFLTQYNPRAKVARDQLLAEQRVCEENIAKLERLRRGFEQEASRNFVDRKLQDLEQERQNIINQLRSIDAEVEQGLALKEFNAVDGGGKRVSDMDELLDKADDTVSKARQMNRELARSFGQPSPGEDSITSSLGQGSRTSSGRAQKSNPAPPRLTGEYEDSRNGRKTTEDSDSGSDTNDPPDIAQKADPYPIRIWTNSRGQRIEAAMVSCDGRMVIIRRKDGGLYTYPITQLSKKCQEYALSTSGSSIRQGSPPPTATKDRVAISKSGAPAHVSYRVAKSTGGPLEIRRGPSRNYPVNARILGSTGGIVQIGNIVFNTKERTYWMPVVFSGVKGYVTAAHLQPE